MKMYLPTPFFQILEKKGERSHQKVIIKEQLENSNIEIYKEEIITMAL